MAPALRATPPAGREEPFWVPSLDQARTMAAATGRPIFVMGYALVGDGCVQGTYRKLGEEYLTDAL